MTNASQPIFDRDGDGIDDRIAYFTRLQWMKDSGVLILDSEFTDEAFWRAIGDPAPSDFRPLAKKVLSNFRYPEWYRALLDDNARYLTEDDREWLYRQVELCEGIGWEG